MKKTLINRFNFYFASLLLITSIMSCSKNEIKKGDKYLFSYDIEEQDPFSLIYADTVTVIDVKNGFILYEWKENKIRQHCSERIFRKCIRY